MDIRQTRLINRLINNDGTHESGKCSWTTLEDKNYNHTGLKE